MTIYNDLVIHGGLGHAVGQSLGVFYVDNGLLRLWEPEWIEGALNVLIGLFCWIGLMTNVTNIKHDEVSAGGDPVGNVGGGVRPA